MAEKSLGRLVWYDLMTHDLQGALAFYRDVFGWEVSEMDLGDAGRYRMWTLDGAGFGGVVPLSAEHDMPSYWLPYATVADVDAALRRAKAAGARIGQPPTDLPELGRYAVVLDREGAGLALWKGITDDVPDEGEQPAGTICWSELLSKDVESATTFYSEVVGWLSQVQDMGDLGDYYLFRTDDDREVAGMKEMPFDAISLPHWLSYVLVPDLDKTAAKVEPAGGKVLVEPSDIPGLGRFFVASDPSGAEIGAVRFGG